VYYLSCNPGHLIRDPQMTQAETANLLREVNNRLRAQLNGSNEPKRFVCECGDPDCQRTVVLTPHAFDARRRLGRDGILAHPS
jgi:hypothetical protein